MPRDNFRLQAIKFFLTYPQCPIKKEVALDLLQAKVALEGWTICEEVHEDGSPHLHCLIKLKKEKNVRSAFYFDLTNDGQTYHGSYEKVKNFAASRQYCKKGGNFLDNFPQNTSS